MIPTPRKHPYLPLARALLFLSPVFLLCGVASAQVTYTYTPNDSASGTGADSWTLGSNWAPTPPVSSIDTTLFFNLSGTNTVVLSNTNTNDLATQPFQLNSLILGGSGSTTAASTITIQSGTLDFVDSTAALAPVINLSAFNNGGGVTYNLNSAVQLGDNVTITGTGNATFNIGGSITGGFGIIMNATGKLTLSGANTYTGTTALNRGVLDLGGAGALSGSGAITFGGGTLQFSGANQSDVSNLIVSSGSAISIDLNGQNVTFSGTIAASNTGGLLLQNTTGSGTLTITGSNSYSGTTTIAAGATLQLGNGATNGMVATGNIVDNALLAYNGNATAQSYAGTATENAYRPYDSPPSRPRPPPGCNPPPRPSPPPAPPKAPEPACSS